MASPVEMNYLEEIEKAKNELEDLVSKNKYNAIDFLRSAYASQFTIAKGGAGTEKKDLETIAKGGAGTEEKHLETIAKGGAGTEKKHLKTIAKIRADHPTITYPDLYQLAGTVAVKELGGPEIKFIPGRKDSRTPPDESCLPDLNRPKDFKKFFDEVQITDPKHMLALYGGLKLAKAGDLTFDNKYFSDLAMKKDQLSDSDKTLYEDFRSNVDRYANNNKEFFKDYAEAHKKLSEFGIEHDKHTPKNFANTPTAVGVGVAIAASVVIFSIFYLIHKRRTQHPSQQFP